MSCSGKVSRTFELLHLFGADEKSQGAAKKNKEKSSLVLVSRNVLFCKKSSNVDNFFPVLGKNPLKPS